MEKEKLDRINELARKAKTVGLTDEETVERAALRQEYIEAFRAGTRATLESIRIQEADGTLTPLRKRKPGEISEKEHHHHHHDGHCCCGHHHDEEKIPEQ